MPQRGDEGETMQSGDQNTTLQDASYRGMALLPPHATVKTVAIPSITCGRPVTGSMMKQITA